MKHLFLTKMERRNPQKKQSSRIHKQTEIRQHTPKQPVCERKILHKENEKIHEVKEDKAYQTHRSWERNILKKLDIWKTLNKEEENREKVKRRRTRERRGGKRREGRRSP